MKFWLGDIPKVMQRNGWLTCAACMERWFRQGGYTMTLDEKRGRVDYRKMVRTHIDTKLVTMGWAMQFKRVSDAAEELRKSWMTPKAIANLRNRVANSGAVRPAGGRGYSFRFGDLGASTIDINETCQANAASIGGMFDPFDDFYAALGRATMNLAVSGECHVEERRIRLLVDHLGIYLRDSYEFMDEQSLGYWNRKGVTSFATNTEDIPTRPTAGADGDWSIGIGPLSTTIERYYRVSNASFRQYRSVSGKGGDFVIFTDVLTTPTRRIEVVL